MKILITCGPTWVKLDDVRVISNQSTGEMGHLIAKAFHKKKNKVTLIEGPVTNPLKVKGIKIIKYRFFEELEEILLAECRKNYDIILHAAAVSDFKPQKPFTKKIDSHKPLTIKLVKTNKIIDKIKKYAPDSFLVGFKLEPDLNEKNMFDYSKGLFINAGCHLVVANTTAQGYQGFIIDADSHILGRAQNKPILVKELLKILS